MATKKLYRNQIDKNKAMGLSWIPFVGWILALCIFLVDYKTLTVEEKRELVCVFICAVLQFIPIVILVVQIISMVNSFDGKFFKIPGIYFIAQAII